MNGDEHSEPNGSSRLDDGGQLRDQAFRSGRYLVGRQLVGIVVRAGSMLLVTGIIGAVDYGRFAGPAAILGVLATLAVFGTDVHLVRATPASQRRDDAVFTMLVISSVVLALVAVGGAHLLGEWWDDPEAVGPMRAIGLAVPLTVLWVPARSVLERRLDFRSVAAIELVADVIGAATSILLAVTGAGVWAPVVGLISRNAWLTISTIVAAGARPRLTWDRREMAAALRFGGGYSAGNGVLTVTRLANPLIVGPLLGPAAVGVVALGQRLVEQLGAVKQATNRLALAGFSRLQVDPQRLASSHRMGTMVQMLGSAPMYAGAAFVAPWLVEPVFGSDWTDLAELLSLLGAAAAIGTMFNLHSSVLVAFGRTAPITRLRLAQLAIVVPATIVLVQWLGIVGFGWAQLVRCSAFVLIHRDVRSIFVPHYRTSLRWFGALVPLMLSPWVEPMLRPLLFVGVIALAARRADREQVVALVRSVIRRDV